jgi:hypothetical protein
MLLRGGRADLSGSLYTLALTGVRSMARSRRSRLCFIAAWLLLALPSHRGCESLTYRPQGSNCDARQEMMARGFEPDFRAAVQQAE